MVDTQGIQLTCDRFQVCQKDINEGSTISSACSKPIRSAEVEVLSEPCGRFPECLKDMIENLPQG
jgi:hypothetical protein